MLVLPTRRPIPDPQWLHGTYVGVRRSQTEESTHVNGIGGVTGLRSAPLLKRIEIPHGVPVVLPLLLEDDVQAVQHGVLPARVAGSSRW